ncbi:hypothetical protein [Cronobacter sakazakii]|uniref:hypothetical protein n=1 Tax=Cronobacter sakazakii TaxID=28141 RepID=UPI00039BF06E|nr:hypothetical protein [Cronobacter sakazakii]
MEKGLLKAVSYMTKIDACARLVLPGNARTFGRGEIKALKTKINGVGSNAHLFLTSLQPYKASISRWLF